MNLQQAREIPITWFYNDILGLTGKKHGRDNILYSSPFREDKTPSLSVSTEKNISYDFATGETRDLVSSIMDYYNLNNPSQALEKLSGLITGREPKNKIHYLNTTTKESSITEDKETYKKTEIIKTKEIYFYPLKNYLKDIRKLSVEKASLYLKEVHFKFSNNPKTYFSLGMQNISNGYEINMHNSIRQQNFKTVIGKKDISFINGTDKETKTILIFEAMFDFLSFLEHEKKEKLKEDVIILHSVSCYKKATDKIKELNKYKEIHLYLDNDKEGKNTISILKQEMIFNQTNEGTRNSTESIKDILSTKYGINILDKSALYKDFKDLNDWWKSKN